MEAIFFRRSYSHEGTEEVLRAPSDDIDTKLILGTWEEEIRDKIKTVKYLRS